MGERRETLSLNIVCFDNRLILLENGKRNLPGIKEKIALRRHGTAGGGGRKLSQEEEEGREFLVDVFLFTPSERHSTIGVFLHQKNFFPVSYRCSNRQKLKNVGKSFASFPYELPLLLLFPPLHHLSSSSSSPSPWCEALI